MVYKREKRSVTRHFNDFTELEILAMVWKLSIELRMKKEPLKKLLKILNPPMKFDGDKMTLHKKSMEEIRKNYRIIE